MATSYATANGVPIVSARICIPREGVWHGDVVVEDDTLLDLALELNINGVLFSATARRVSVVEGSGLAQFTAGAGGMGKPVTPRMYSEVPLKIPLGDIAKAAGETLAAAADPAVLKLQLRKWTMLEGKAGAALNTLIHVGAASSPASWRFLLDGTLWVGKESWPAVTVDHQVLLEDVLADRAILYLEEPSLLPGQTFLGRRVSYVEHHLSEAKIRSSVWFERTTP